MSKFRDEQQVLRAALVTALAYAGLALLWILFSDRILLQLVDGDVARLAKLQTLKGGAFVTVTALLLFLLVHRVLSAQAAFSRDARRLATLIRRSPVIGIEWRASTGWPVTFVSDNIREWGHDPRQLVTREVVYADLVHPDDHDRIAAEMARHLANGPDNYRQEYRLRYGDGHWIWVDDRTWLIRDSNRQVRLIQGVLLDVTARVADRQLAAARIRILKDLISRAPLEQLLDSVCLRVESLYPGLHAAAFLRDAEIRTLRCSAAPNLPGDLVELITGASEMPCALSVIRGDPVVVADLRMIMRDAACRQAALAAGYLACWAVPFRDAGGAVLGTLAAFVDAPREPSDSEMAALNEFAGFCGLAVEKSRAAQAIQYRERALQAVAGMTLSLLRQEDTEHVMETVLGDLGMVSQADRVYVFELHKGNDPDRPLCSHRFEWVREGVSPQLRNPKLQNIDLQPSLSRWHEYLQRGDIIKGLVQDFPASERPFLESQQISSVLIVPIVVEGRLWGFLGFDAVSSNRVWSNVDESVLRIVAAAIGGATERRRALDKQRLAAAVIASTRDGVLVTDLSPAIVWVNPAFTRITGYPESEAVGRNPRFLQSGRHGPEFFQGMWQALTRDGHWRGEVWNRRRNGEIYPEWLSISRVVDTGGRPTHYTAVFTDISEIKRTEEQLEYLAHHDALTDLPNRVLAQLRLEQALTRTERNRDRVAVLYLDLDHFKTINDSLGHPVGDRLLIEVARRFSGRIRAQDTLARLGGDEFLLVLEQVRSPDAAAQLAAALLRLLEEPLVTEHSRELFVSASIGISVFPDDAASATELIQHADAAMYQAKAQGRNTYRFYTEELTHAANRRLSLEGRLRRAIERGELLLHFQPQVDIRTATPLGVEALVRWQPPGGRLIPPSEFIPVAEDSGLIVSLGDWVLHAACAQARAWRDAGLPPLRMAVNLSGHQWIDKDMLASIRTALDQSGLDPGQLELEVTETTMMQHGGG